MKNARHLFASTRSEAAFSDDGAYRFWLCREWGVKTPFGVFFMQNPSRADALRGDDTALSCNNLAVEWGWRGFGIVNLNPFIHADPQHVPKSILPIIQEENDGWIGKTCRMADYFVLATGGGWRKATTDTLKRLCLDGDFYMIDRNKSNDSFLHPRGVDASRYPKPKRSFRTHQE